MKDELLNNISWLFLEESSSYDNEKKQINPDKLLQTCKSYVLALKQGLKVDFMNLQQIYEQWQETLANQNLLKAKEELVLVQSVLNAFIVLEEEMIAANLKNVNLNPINLKQNLLNHVRNWKLKCQEQLRKIDEQCIHQAELEKLNKEIMKRLQDLKDL